jgi:hypothetical protein
MNVSQLKLRREKLDDDDDDDDNNNNNNNNNNNGLQKQPYWALHTQYGRC